MSDKELKLKIYKELLNINRKTNNIGQNRRKVLLKTQCVEATVYKSVQYNSLHGNANWSQNDKWIHTLKGLTLSSVGNDMKQMEVPSIEYVLMQLFLKSVSFKLNVRLTLMILHFQHVGKYLRKTRL